VLTDVAVGAIEEPGRFVPGYGDDYPCRRAPSKAGPVAAKSQPSPPDLGRAAVVAGPEIVPARSAAAPSKDPTTPDTPVLASWPKARGGRGVPTDPDIPLGEPRPLRLNFTREVRRVA
jgi:hypothetical protein